MLIRLQSQPSRCENPREWSVLLLLLLFLVLLFYFLLPAVQIRLLRLKGTNSRLARDFSQLTAAARPSRFRRRPGRAAANVWADVISQALPCDSAGSHLHLQTSSPADHRTPSSEGLIGFKRHTATCLAPPPGGEALGTPAGSSGGLHESAATACRRASRREACGGCK